MKNCRRALVEHSMLRKPEERSSGFLTTTLRRYINRAKMDQMAASSTDKDYDKLFTRTYWSYTKSLIRHPLTVRLKLPSADDLEDPDVVCLKLFNSIQQHAGKCVEWPVASAPCATSCTIQVLAHPVEKALKVLIQVI